MSNWGSKFAKCPFFRTYSTNKIVCEGLKDGNTINLVYESQPERKKYMSHNCSSMEGYQLCPIYKMLFDRYDQ